MKEKLGVPSLHWSLQNISRKKFTPINVVDAGAYEGEWTKDFLEVFPTANIMMIEAQSTKKNILEKIKTIYPSVSSTFTLLSSEDGTSKYFFESETASHVVDNDHNKNNLAIIKSRTLDSVLKENKFPFPDFIKLDVQGHELEVLKGASLSLASAQICLLEVSLLNLGDNNPLFAEVVKLMDIRSFQIYDISQFMRRPLDQTLYQLDVFFVKKDSFLLAEKSWN